MAQSVAGEKYFKIDGQLLEIKRQLRQENGYPFDVDKLSKHLQDAVEGRFVKVGEPRIISIDRTVPFDPVVLLGEGWKIVEQDERSLALTEIDLAKVHLEICLKLGEKLIKGEEKLKRLKKDGRIRLDAKIFQMLWENQHMIPGIWKEKISSNTCYIFFDGTVLRSPGGGRSVLCLCWDDGKWHWYYYWLESDWGGGFPSAVLTSI